MKIITQFGLNYSNLHCYIHEFRYHVKLSNVSKSLNGSYINAQICMSDILTCMHMKNYIFHCSDYRRCSSSSYSSVQLCKKILTCLTQLFYLNENNSDFNHEKKRRVWYFFKRFTVQLQRLFMVGHKNAGTYVYTHVCVLCS